MSNGHGYGLKNKDEHYEKPPNGFDVVMQLLKDITPIVDGKMIEKKGNMIVYGQTQICCTRIKDLLIQIRSIVSTQRIKEDVIDYIKMDKRKIPSVINEGKEIAHYATIFEFFDCIEKKKFCLLAPNPVEFDCNQDIKERAKVLELEIKKSINF